MSTHDSPKSANMPPPDVNIPPPDVAVSWNDGRRAQLSPREWFDAVEGAELAEYRLDDLVRRSGVSSRNIRAYQERGLLNPPKREGRVAIYDERHLWQLEIITELLRKGYSVAHIQDFFEGFAKNLNLADTLGIQELAEKTGMQQALLAPWSRGERRRRAANEPTQPLRVDRSSQLARSLVHHGIARHEGDDLVIVDEDIAALVADAKDETFYLRVLVGVCEATTQAVQHLAEATVDELRNKLVEHYGEGWIPPVDQQREVAEIITDVRELGAQVVDNALSEALKTNAIRVVTEYYEGIMAAQDGTYDELVRAVTAGLDRD